MEERRNYYRILQVQPDAPPEVIRNNYRALLQKLKLHPDLGGDGRDAATLNVAYQTLRDPTRRAAYDRDLLSRYSLVELATAGQGTRTYERPKGTRGNRRNYYRVLQVQPDASDVIIRASYRALVAGADGDERALIEHAYHVLGEPTRRAAYDGGVDEHRATGLASVPESPAPVSRDRLPVLASDAEDYQPLIHQYCQFCKTPYRPRPEAELEERSCLECHSPLGLAVLRGTDVRGRDAIRLLRDAAISVRLDWPGAPVNATLRDLSPHGALIHTGATLTLEQVLQLEAPGLDAVARVAHCQVDEAGTRAGLDFLTARFHEGCGNFVSTVA
ncbi:MAG: DnaJ domain-containing protein [Pseudomonadota bacterium]